MEWCSLIGTLCTLFYLCKQVTGVNLHLEFADVKSSRPYVAYNASLGDGWSYFIESQMVQAETLLSLDSSTGYLYVDGESICDSLIINPLSLEIISRAHHSSSLQTSTNFTITKLTIYFYNLPCSVPEHRKTVLSSLTSPSLAVVTFSDMFSMFDNFRCIDEDKPLLNLKNFLSSSLKHTVCDITIESDSFHYDSVSSYIVSSHVQCLFNTKFFMPVVLKPCNGSSRFTEPTYVIIEINFSSQSSLVKSSAKTKIKMAVKAKTEFSQGREKRQTDNTAPSFAQSLYTATVAENQPAASVIQITATDSDSHESGKLTYSMQSMFDIHSNDMFSIDPISGVISTTVALDREDIPLHRFFIIATDGGATFSKSATTSLMVTVEDRNDHKPVFEPNEYHIQKKENLPVTSVILTLRATDADAGDNADIRYSIVDPPNSQMFKIEPVNGVVTSMRTLDRESQANYRLVIQAIDQAPFGQQQSSSATVFITVLDENDNTPQFAQDSYVVNVTENLDITDRPVIAHITATDADEGLNKQITYSITNGNINNTFYIDPSAGTVAVQKPLDYETNQNFQLRIKAADHGADNGEISKQNSTTLWVRIEDINDHAPYFQSSLYSASVTEGTKIGTSVLTVRALDKDSGDNAKLQYSLVDVQQSFPFAIHGDSGQISVRATIDREIQAQYLFSVQVQDKGQPPLSTTVSVQITVNDVNDNSPVFSQKVYSESISEDAPLYIKVVEVTATDRDSDQFGQLRYEIVSGNTNQMFAIGRDNGQITLRKKLDYKVQSRYVLNVRAYDIDDNYDDAEVRINVTDINKQAPEFTETQFSFSIFEGEPVGTSVGEVSARDSDVGENGRITYEILNGIQEFAINPNTGEITTREILDRENRGMISFDVRASDNGNPPMSNTANVYVVVDDINDCKPYFQTNYTANVSEAANEGLLVVTVHARDDDVGINSNIMYKFAPKSDGKDDFEIDLSTGSIFVAKTKPGQIFTLDRERQSNYTLTVLAVDSGHIPLTGTTEVKIKVDDVNDNAPQFATDNIKVLVPENLKIGSTVAVISAVDPDEGVNAVIEYSFESGGDADKFVPQNRPGEPLIIINHIDLDYEAEKNSYTIYVKAASKNLISRATVTIQVQDVNDNKPVLEDFTIIFNNYEFNFPYGPIGRIPAFDPDVSDRNKLSYSFPIGNEAGFLKVNSTTGDITLDSRLNSDVPRNGTIQVRVSDGSNHVTATCSLQVRLVTQEMLENSVTIRINNMTSQAFLSPLFGFFVEALATTLNVQKNSIYVINVRNDTEVTSQILNVTVAVWKKSIQVDRQKVDIFYTTEFLKEQIYLQRTWLANMSTLQILPFDDNLCVVEICQYFKRCLTKLMFDHAAPFISSNTMLFRPIYPTNSYRCVCPEGFTWYETYKTCDREINLCYSNPCKNGATCHSKEGGYTCQCANGFAGVFCEINTSVKFENSICPAGLCKPPSRCVPLIEGGFRCEGCPNNRDYNRFCELRTCNFPKGSFLAYPTIKSRYRFKIQLTFATQEKDGLMFYNGRFNEFHDFMALELVDGQVQFTFSTGEQPVKVAPYIPGGVNDGKWHSVTVDYLNMTATVSVGEDCDPEISVKYGASIGYTCAARGTLTFGPQCFKEGNVNNCGQLLDLTGPLQIGGLPTLPSNFKVHSKDYVGCISDFYIDNHLLDFNAYVTNNGTDTGCSRKRDFCQSAPCKHGGTCMEGWDSYRCACPSRWDGKDCSLSIDQPRKLIGDGYLTYSTAAISPVHFKIGWFNGVSFRTRSKNGTLLFIVAEDGETVHLELVNGVITYNYVNTQGSQMFAFDSTAVNDGQWHFIEARWLNTGDLILDLDYGQRVQFGKIQSTIAGKAIESVYAGALTLGPTNPENYFTGCIQNVQLGNAGNSVLSILKANNALAGCDGGDNCASQPCNMNAQCHNEWEGHTCKCPAGTLGPDCKSICTNFYPCKNEAYCRHPAGGTYMCECGEDQSGEYCQHTQEKCPQKWWGFPVCGPCPKHCTVENGFNPNCNNKTGVCTCRSNHYRPAGSDVCLPCNCYGHGSSSISCDLVSGQCPCVEGVIGRRCDQCPSKYAEIRKDEKTGIYSCKVDYEACPRVFSHGMWWDTDLANVMITQSCPGSAKGEAYRNCTAAGLWDEPDFFNCTNTAFVAQLSKVEDMEAGVLEINTFVANKTIASLVGATSRTAALYGNDVNITLRLLHQLLTFENRQSGLNLTSEQHSRYLSNLVSVLSDVLQRRYIPEWSRLTTSTTGTGEIMQQLETYLDRLLSALELTNTDSPRPYNVISDNIVLSVDFINKENFSGRNIPKYDNIVKSPMFDKDTNIYLPKSAVGKPLLRDFLQPSIVTQSKAYVGYILFKDMGDLLPQAYSSNVRRIEGRPLSVNTPVFTVLVKDNGQTVTQLNQSVVITFKQLQMVNRTSPQCVAWVKNAHSVWEWSTAGCTLGDRFEQDGDMFIKCSCDHMTTFAVLMDISDHEYVPAEPVSIEVISYIGLIVSMGCLLVTFIVLFYPKKIQSNSNSIHLNMIFVIFVAQLTFLIGIGNTEQEFICRLTAIALHYFYMTGFSWLFVDILHDYRMLTEIRQINMGSMKFYYLIAYVIPGIIVSLAVGLNTEGYGNESFCWLSMMDQFIWSFAGPVCLSVIVNIFMFVLAMRSSCREKVSIDDVSALRVSMFANITVLMLWGISWMIGLLSVNYNYAALHVIYALLCLLIGVFVFIIYVIVNKQVRHEMKKLWYKCRGLKLDLDDNIAGTRTSVYSRSALAYRNDSCDNTLSRINVGISTTSTTSRSTSKSSGGLYKGEDYLRSTSTSTSGGMPPLKYPKSGLQPPPYGYDSDKPDGIDAGLMQIPKRDNNDSDSDSEMSEHSNLDLASSHSSDDEDDMDIQLNWESTLPKNKKIEEAQEQIRKKKEELLQKHQQQQQQFQQQHAVVTDHNQHQYQNPFDHHIYAGGSPTSRFSPKPSLNAGQWPGDPQLAGPPSDRSDSEYRSDIPVSTLSSTQPDVTLQTPEYIGRGFKVAQQRHMDTIANESGQSTSPHVHSPLGSPHVKHTPLVAPRSPELSTGSPHVAPRDKMTVKVLTHQGSVSSDSECSHETCV